MPHETALISTIAVGLSLAFIGGFIATRLKLPSLVGYLLAGVLVGPFTPGFVADTELAPQLAEIGVILLMFGVGMHFSVRDLMAVRKIAVPGAIVQIAAATALGAALASFWGWSLGAGLVLGLALSVASTVVLLRALEEQGTLDSVNGKIAVGWLIVEDLVMVLALVLLPAFAGFLGAEPESLAANVAGENWLLTVALTIGKVAAFIGLMLIVGVRVFPWILSQVSRVGSKELFTLCVAAVALGIAYGSAKLFGVSFALGAFFAGIVINESDLSHRAADESLPLQNVFAVLFFVSVGMLFDPAILIEQPLQVLAVVAIIVIGKSVAACLIVLAFRYPLNTALSVSASLAQIGEFSFILAGLGVSLKLLPAEGQNLILAGALLSITLNPLIFRAFLGIEERLRTQPQLASFFEERPADELSETPVGVDEQQLQGHAVLIGYGRVGSIIGGVLARQGIPYAVIEQNREYAEELRNRGVPTIYGDATVAATLEHAHLECAKLLIITAPDAFEARRILELSRQTNPDIEVVVRTHSDAEREYLEQQGVGLALMGERELALGMCAHILRSFAIDAGEITATKGRQASAHAEPGAVGGAEDPLLPSTTA
ncbi:YbaL family putative K(+) efflux transporter [Gloeobacter morelensis]|uniref:Kef family K(+) transporter n=1 Tax=Gloeobacter morelensis MG652769 TaxID=2781736 RepID=A0ABY3PGW5_9CYAN|nr:YbaL family putative K(+) efflux transporter [Gloeobacter morelensis]UFP92871.1 Kef family K(+) transporter [Gloeobacter morelensis MG652769]